MTVGIACVCEKGDCFVLSSDMRATYGTAPHGANYERVGPNDQCGKLFFLQPRLIGCVAGRMSECHAVIANMVFNLRLLNKARQNGREFIASAVDAARVREMRRLYAWTIEKNWGISLNEFHRGKVPGGKLDDLLLRACHNLLKETQLRVHLLVVGFVKGSGVFLRAIQKDALQEEPSPGVYAIGAGSVQAMRVLNRRGQNYGMSLPRTLFHMHEAMLAAKKETTVGPAQGYIVIRKRVPVILFVRPDSLTMANWTKVYAKRRNTGSLDDSKVAAMEINQQLLPLKIFRQNKAS
jgi:hypothetical protein